MKILTAGVALIFATTLTGCAMTKTEERVFKGALIGAGAGAAIGSTSGSAGAGAAIGAGVGAVGGLIYDQDRKHYDTYHSDRHYHHGVHHYGH